VFCRKTSSLYFYAATGHSTLLCVTFQVCITHVPLTFDMNIAQPVHNPLKWQSVYSMFLDIWYWLIFGEFKTFPNTIHTEELSVHFTSSHSKLCAISRRYQFLLLHRTLC